MANQPNVVYVWHALLQSVVDGDTLSLQLDIGLHLSKKTNCRLARLNAPEPRGCEFVAGGFVTEQVKRWLFDRSVWLVVHSERLSKYGEPVVDVWSDNQNLNAYLLDQSLAWPVDENGSLIGNRDIDRLVGLPEEIRAEVRRQSV